MQIRTIGIVLAVGVATHGIATQAAAQVETPSQLYGQLFEDVQMQRVFPDGKTFVDAIAKDAPAIIVQRYQEEKQEPGFDLAAFVARNFTVQRPKDSGYHSIPGQDVCSHIDSLWSVLAREPDRADPRSSLLPLPYPYVVPGGRFNEIYYWDSYFTMLGLEESGRHDMALNMVRNFVSLITRYGHVPNGNRTYYLSRSQPPFFAAMVELIADEASDRGAIYAEFLGALSEEYAFWMDGADALAPGSAHRRRRAPQGWHASQSLLGRSQHPARGILPGGRGHGEGRRPATRGGLPEPARGGRERLGLQLALAQGRQDAFNHPHHGARAGRSQQPHGPARDDPCQGLRSHPQAGEGGRVQRPCGAAQGVRCGATCGMPTRASLPTTCGARRSRAAR